MTNALTQKPTSLSVPNFRPRSPSRRQIITPAEHAVLNLLASGFTSRVIGELLGIAQDTVSVHRSHLMRKLGLRQPKELIGFAIAYKGHTELPCSS